MRICLVVFLLAILIGCAGDTAPANPVEAQGEVSNLGGARIRLGMTRDEVLEALGEFEFTLDESGTVRGYSPLTPDTDDVGSIYFGDDGLVSRINRNWRQSENQESVVLAEALLGALRPMLDAGGTCHSCRIHITEEAGPGIKMSTLSVHIDGMLKSTELRIYRLWDSDYQRVSVVEVTGMRD